MNVCCSSIDVYYDDPIAVTGVTLAPSTAQTINVGGSVSFTATITPSNATDKKVKWSTTGGVTLYSDSNCTQAVGTTATSTLTVYAKGTSAGSATVTVTTNDANKTANCAVTVTKSDPTAPTGLTATYGQTLANVELPEGWSWVPAATTSVGSVGSNTFKANFAGNDNYYAASNVDVAVTVSKAANPATVAGTATVIRGGNTVDLAGNVTKNGATGDVSYAISGEANGCSLSGSVLTSGDNTGTVTVNVTVATDDNYNALAATPITVTISDKGTQTITAADVTATYGDTDKKVNASVTDPATGGGAISYTVKDGSEDYIEVNATTGALTIKKVGTATVIVTAAETSTYAQATKEVTVTINKANAVAATVTANNRTYDGTEKPLVTVTGEPTGGEMYYALGENETTAPADNLYTTSIPAKTDAGTYYIWYKVTGNENYLNADPAGPVEVIMKKKAVTVTANEQTVKEGGAIAAGADNAKLDGAADGHKLADVKLASSSTAAATTEGEIAPSDAVIKDGNGTDVTGNYEITYVKGKLTVTAENQEDGTIKTDAHVDEKAPQTKVENLTPELAKSLLTEEEVKQLEEGATVLLYLDVKNIDETVSAEDKDLTEGKAKEISGGAKVGMYLDLSLFKKVGNNDSVKVTDTNGQKVRAVFEVPENLRGGADVIRTFYIARIHDGKIEILAQSTDTSIPVDSDLFSTYSLLFSDQPVYEGFIDRVYGVLLGRKVDPAGLASWKEALEKKEVTAAQVIEGVIYSSEYLANNKGELNKDDTNEVFVDKMYLAILNRKADDEGKKIWLDLLEQGYSRKYVLAQFVNSGEFEKICTDAGYTKGKVALTEEEKTPDTNNKHIDVEQVKAFVTRLYTVVLGRDPDKDGMDYWVDQIVSRKKTAEWVATYGFFSSKEYLEKDKSAADFLADNYAAMMDRTPDAEGLKYWEDKLAGGMKREQVTSVGFGKSKEFSEILTRYGLK